MTCKAAWIRVLAAMCCVAAAARPVGGEGGPRQTETMASSGHKLLIVAPTNERRFGLLRDGAATWRTGVHAFYVVNGTVEGAIPPPNGADPAHETWRVSDADALQRRTLRALYDMCRTRHLSCRQYRSFLRDLHKKPPPVALPDGRYSFPDEWPFPDPRRPPDAPGLHEKRYVASVRLANKSMAGRWDWLLVGDDDTVWFLDNVRSMLDGLDSSLPYFLSDNLGGCCPGHGQCAYCTRLRRLLMLFDSADSAVVCGVPQGHLLRAGRAGHRLLPTSPRG